MPIRSRAAAKEWPSMRQGRSMAPLTNPPFYLIMRCTDIQLACNLLEARDSLPALFDLRRHQFVAPRLLVLAHQSRHGNPVASEDHAVSRRLDLSHKLVELCLRFCNSHVLHHLLRRLAMAEPRIELVD